MASIDKIYGNIKQYDDFYNWCERNKPEALDCFYPRDTYEGDDRPITSFTTELDMFMVQNCPLDFVKERIVEQYSLKLDHANDVGCPNCKNGIIGNDYGKDEDGFMDFDDIIPVKCPCGCHKEKK